MINDDPPSQSNKSLKYISISADIHSERKNKSATVLSVLIGSVENLNNSEPPETRNPLTSHSEGSEI